MKKIKIFLGNFDTNHIHGLKLAKILKVTKKFQYFFKFKTDVTQCMLD